MSQPSRPLFGGLGPASQQPLPAGGLLGLSSPVSAQPAAASQTPATRSLFGSLHTPQPQNTSAFGTLGQPQQLGGSVLGGAGTSQSMMQQTQQAPQQGTNLFGAQNATNTMQQQQQQQQQQQTQPQLQQAQQPVSSLFGSSQPRPNPFPSLLNPTNQAQQPKPSLFGASAAPVAAPAAPAQPLFGGNPNTTNRLGRSLLGQSTTTQTVPGIKIDISQIRGTTRFNDLHEELQKQIENVDAQILQHINFFAQCEGLMPNHAASVFTISNDADFIANKLETAELAIDNDLTGVSKLKEQVDRDIEDARLSWRAIENLKLPPQFHYSGLVWPGASSSYRPAGSSSSQNLDATEEAATSTNLVAYFSARADLAAKTLAEYRRTLTEIENHIQTVEANAMAQTEALVSRRGPNGAGGSGGGSRDDDLRNLSAVFADFERGILGVASKLGTAREAVVEVSLGGDDRISNGKRPTGR